MLDFPFGTCRDVKVEDGYPLLLRHSVTLISESERKNPNSFVGNLESHGKMPTIEIFVVRSYFWCRSFYVQ